MRYGRSGGTSKPGLRVHPYVNSRVISQFCTPTTGAPKALSAALLSADRVLFRPPLDRVAVRDGPGRLGAKFLLRLERPVRLPEHLPRQEHQVGVAAGHDLVGVSGLGDQPD